MIIPTCFPALDLQMSLFFGETTIEHYQSYVSCPIRVAWPPSLS